MGRIVNSNRPTRFGPTKDIIGNPRSFMQDLRELEQAILDAQIRIEALEAEVKALKK